MEQPKVVLRRGGYFVTFETGWSGPWATEEAAEFARKRDFDAAHRAQRVRNKQ